MKNIALIVLLTSLLTLSNAQTPQDNFQLPLSPNATISNQIATISVQGKALTSEENLALGILHFLESIEGLSQAWYDYGLGQGAAVNSLNMGSTLLGVTEPPVQNPKPQSITYKDFRKILQKSISQLETASRLMSKQLDLLLLPEDIKLTINIDELAFDANGNNKIEPNETIGQFLATMAGVTVNDLELNDAITISFDQGDIYWLNGYSHLLMAFLEIVLAHDSTELFDSTAHLFFPLVDSPYSDVLQNQISVVGLTFEEDTTLVDAIALLHFVLRVDVLEPERLTSALLHAQEVTKQSKLMWQSIQAETDNDNEWIPNANQDSVIGINVDQAQIDNWLGFVDDAEQIWQGNLLIPHWRVVDGKGINLKRVFTEPQTFDIVMWLQGTAAVPYLEEGEIIDEEKLQELWDAFGGNLFGFAAWFN